MTRPRPLAAAAAALALAAAPAAAGPRPEALRAHTVFLAHDLLEGRESGARGYDIAAAYVASQFMALGLEPAGDAGTFLQTVRLQRRSLEPGGVSFAYEGPAGRRGFANGVDIAVDASPRATREVMEAPLVFAGYGIHAPGLGRDDFAGLDVEGKAVVILEGAPAELPGALRAHYSWIQQKERMAAARGAAALLTLKSPAREKVSPWDRTRRLRPLPQLAWVDAQGRPAGDAVAATVTLGPEAAEAIFQGAPRTLEAVYAESARGWIEGFALPGRVRLARRSAHETAEAANVVAVLPGADPRLRHEYVVVTGHLDHVGIGPPVDGDAIYNGAVDNAGGIAVMIELARTLAEGPRPRRSVLFLATAAEEKGLLGSDYFVSHSPVPVRDMAAVINLDGLMTFYDFSDVVAYGAEHSTLGEALARAARQVDAVLVPDPEPERGNFALSDQYPFARLGVPALFTQPGPGPSRDGATTGAAVSEWEAAHHYHQPSDEADLPFHWPAAARWTELHRRLVLEVANAPRRPRWRRGDPAAAVFAPRP